MPLSISYPSFPDFTLEMLDDKEQFYHTLTALVQSLRALQVELLNETIDFDLTASEAVVSDADGELTTQAGVSATEVSYLNGVTSAIQTQLDAKAALASPTFTGDPKAPTPAAGDNDTSIATTAFVNTEIASDAAALITTHEAASDPHTGYQKESEKGAASGYASLDADTLLVEPAALIRDSSDGVTLQVKRLDMGDWDMDGSSTLTVAHGLTLNKIRAVTFMIRNDAVDTQYPESRQSSGVPDASVASIDATNVILARVAGGLYDATTFDATGFNRGWIIIIHTT